MNKICTLTPCLMLDNTRDINKECLEFVRKHLAPDASVIYDQCFTENDYNPNYTYIAHADKRMGWVAARNGLLNWFYNSDYDYAFWIDANSKITNTTLNDITTILDSLRDNKLPQVDTIFSTLGMWNSQERQDLKQEADYFDNVHLVPARLTKNYDWMHGLIIKNFKKYYNQEFYIDERCDVMQGTAEDVYFSRLLRRVTKSYIAPTVVCTKPRSDKSCTMDNGTGKYNYPPVKYSLLDEWVEENKTSKKYRHVEPTAVPKEIIIPRGDYMRETIKPFRSKARIKVDTSTTKTVLW